MIEMIERRRVNNFDFRCEWNRGNLIVQRRRCVIAIVVVVVVWSRDIAAIAVICRERSEAGLVETGILLIVYVDELLGFEFSSIVIGRLVQDEEIWDDCEQRHEESEKFSYTNPWRVHLKVKFWLVYDFE